MHMLRLWTTSRASWFFFRITQMFGSFKSNSKRDDYPLWPFENRMHLFLKIKHFGCLGLEDFSLAQTLRLAFVHTMAVVLSPLCWSLCAFQWGRAMLFWSWCLWKSLPVKFESTRFCWFDVLVVLPNLKICFLRLLLSIGFEGTLFAMAPFGWGA